LNQKPQQVDQKIHILGVAIAQC